MSSEIRLVVDASVALKWVLHDEEAVDEAAALRDDAVERELEMVSPSLWIYEIANGLVGGIRRKRISRRLGDQALQELLAVWVRLVDPDPATVVELSIEHGLSSYDAAYVALADVLDSPLWTGDRKLHRALAGALDFVHWIGDYRAVTS
ncbi:MAG: type II toxin-antitoxin system VapC family toxin [Actinomycetota bacterium]